MEITSLHNPRIKQVTRLQGSAKERRETGMFIVEGRREISLAQQSGIEASGLFLCPGIYSEDQDYKISFQEGDLFEVPEQVYDKIAYRSGVEGVIGIFKKAAQSPTRFISAENPLFLVLEKVEKPGNLGAIFRTADAAKVSGIIICDQVCDLYNPNTIRASLGCVFTVPSLVSSTPEVISLLQSHNIQILASTPAATSHYFDSDYTGPSAIIMGAEDTGLSDSWLKSGAKLIKIPMNGRIDSLNVSVATAILTFEAVKQRFGKQ